MLNSIIFTYKYFFPVIGHEKAINCMCISCIRMWEMLIWDFPFITKRLIFFNLKHTSLIQSLSATDTRLQLRRRIGFVWVPDQQPWNALMLTKVVIWTTSFKAEWGHQLTGKNKQTCAWRELNLQQKKVLGVSFQISTKSAEAREREAPSLLQASSKKAEWTQSRHVRGCSGRQSCQEAAGQMAVGVCIWKVGRNLFLCDNIGKSDLLHMLPFPRLSNILIC